MEIFLAYGRCIEADLSFDALPVPDKVTDLISLHIQHAPIITKDLGTPVRPCIAQGRAVHLVDYGSHIVVQVDLILSFEFRFSANHIECVVSNEVSDNLLRYWILQQILPLYLLLSGSTEFLHGMGVSSLGNGINTKEDADRRCMAFLGESYAGKSTLLSYFLERGHAPITDDQLALSRQNYTTVFPAGPYCRSYRASEDLGIPATTYSPDPSELQRIYLLEPAPAEAALQKEILTGMKAVTALFSHIHYTLYNASKVDFFPLVEDRFRGLAEIARKVPIARLHVPRSLARLPEVYDFIQSDLTS